MRVVIFLTNAKKLIGVAKNTFAPLGRRLMCFGSKLADCSLFESSTAITNTFRFAANHAKHSPVKDCSVCFSIEKHNSNE